MRSLHNKIYHSAYKTKLAIDLLNWLIAGVCLSYTQCKIKD